MKHGITRLGAVGALTLALAMGAGVGAAFADEDTSPTEPLLEASSVGLHTDYVGSTSTLASTTFPTAFDLRYYNGTATYDSSKGRTVFTGGWNYMTPVKKQDPFGTCWAFSITSAAETSMITALDKADDGLMNGSVTYETAAASGDDTIAKKASNLSERHLAYFQFSHPTSTGLYPLQSGEGKYLLSGSTDAATMMAVGGSQTLGLAIYSSGIGPVRESIAPYISDEGWIRTYGMLGNDTPTLNMYFSTYAEAKAYVDTTWTDANIAKFNAKYGVNYTAANFLPRIAKIGTWAVSNDKMFGYTAELDNSNTIPSEKNTDGSLLTSEVEQMKAELSNGHPLSISYRADQAMPGDTVTGKSYLNTSTWGQYTYETATQNHAVTIVGWDDDYAASNFTHNIYKTDGTIDEEATAKTTPPGKGAWIVRNSWGSENNANPLYENKWGVDGSGYFYLSYYDWNLGNIESYEFDVSTEAQARSSYDSYQHDLSNADNLKSEGSSDVVKTCNVFDGPEAGSNFTTIRDLGFLTGSANTTTTLEVYVMNDSEEAVEFIKNNSPTATATSTQSNAGYHRVHLGDKSFKVSADQKFAVVQTTQRSDNTYERTYRYGDSFEYMTSYTDLMKKLDTSYNSTENMYFNTVMNTGESLLYSGNDWQDWKTAAAAIDSSAAATETANVRKAAEEESDPTKKAAMEAYYTSSRYAIDNFMIKAYGDVHVCSFTDYVYNNDATCTVDGTETAACPCGKTDTRTKAGSKLGHSFGDPVVTFSQDLTTATAVWTCTRDDKFQVTATSAITQQIITAATCFDDGEAACAAAFQAENGTLTKVENRTETLAAIGHHFENELCVDCNTKLGDANANGKVNIVDAQIAFDIANNVYAAPTKAMSTAANVTDGGKGESVSADDARAIQYYVHNGEFGDE